MTEMNNKLQQLTTASNDLLESLKGLFVEKVINSTQNESVLFRHLMTFKYSDSHKTSGQYTKLIFQKTNVISQFQQWLNMNYPFTTEDGHVYQKYFCRFYSFGSRGTPDETFQFNVNWDRRSWKNHKPLESFKKRPFNRNRHTKNNTTQLDSPKELTNQLTNELTNELTN